MKKLSIPGFTENVIPTDKPCVVVYALENAGKTRFGCTLPHDEGFLAFICLDKNSKRTVQAYKQRWNLPVLVNEKDYLTDGEAIRLARLDCKVERDRKETKEIYTRAVSKLTDDVSALVENDMVQSIVVDQASQLYDWILFSHFGRKNQIESFSRAAPNQDMIDIVNMLRNKNSLLIHKATEVWKSTGERDSRGREKQAPSGTYKPEGMGKIGGFVTAVVMLEVAKLKPTDRDLPEEEQLQKKYRCKVVTCKGNTLLEGLDLADYGMCGEAISWQNLMSILGLDT